eukprot:868945-Prorocentrum_minimum.AAC.7
MSNRRQNYEPAPALHNSVKISVRTSDGAFAVIENNGSSKHILPATCFGTCKESTRYRLLIL